jgi:hypothetical protein
VGTGGGARSVDYEYLGKMKPGMTHEAAASPDQADDSKGAIRSLAPAIC